MILTTRAESTEITSIAETAAEFVDERLPGTMRTMTLAASREYRFAAGRFGADAVASIGTFVSDEEMFDVVAGSLDAKPGRDRLAASLAATAAAELGIGIGDVLDIDRRSDGIIAVEIVALVEPTDRLDDLWMDQAEFRDGARVIGNSRSFGPLLVSASTFAALDVPATVTWRAVVDAQSVGPADTVALRTSARQLDTSLADALPAFDVDISIGLDRLLQDTDTSLGSSGAVIAVILLQIVGLALSGLALASSVLSASRLVETSLLRSRGATAQQMGVLAAIEALLVVVPAAIAGPLLAKQVVKLIAQWGPVATTGLDLDPAVTVRAIVASAVVAVAAIVVIVWPAVRSAQALSERKAEQVRATRRNVLQRSGADVVVATLAVLALWQLTQSSAATRDLAGRLGTDPILVLAPTLGVIAASLVTLRLIGVLAQAMQNVAASGSGLSVALAGWELARRPDRTSRTSVLVVLSVTIGTFASVQGASWERSQRDQADAIASADLTVRPDPRPAATVGPLVFAEALGQLDGVAEAAPFDRSNATVSNNSEVVAAVAVDAASIDAMLRLRDDLRTNADLAVLRDPVDLGAMPLGDVDGDLTMSIAIDRGGAAVDGEIELSAFVVDRHGTIHRIASDPVGADTPVAVVTFPLTQRVGDDLIAMAGPVSLLRLDVAAPIANGAAGGATPAQLGEFTLTITDIRMGSRQIVLPDRPWVVAPLPVNNNTLSPGSASARSAGGALVIEFDTGVTAQRRARLTAQIAAGDVTAGSIAESPVIPAFVTPAFLDTLELDVGDVALVRLAGMSAALRIDGVVPVVPFAVEVPDAVLIDWSTVVAAQYGVTGRFEAPSDFVVRMDNVVSHDAADDAADDVAGRIGQIRRQVSAEPFLVAEAVDRLELASRLADDPFAVGLFGSLSLALAGSLLVAVVGLVLTAVVGARERRTAYSVLRAMGAPVGLLRRWLLLEVVPLVAVSAVAGLVAGVVLARIALDALTVTSAGTPAIPPPRLVVPWTNVGGIVAVAIVAGIIVPLLTGRLLGRTNTADSLRIGDAA